MSSPSSVSCRVDSLQQSKARLELAIQTTKQQHQKELESRDEEIEQIKNAMSKKVGQVSLINASLTGKRLVMFL